MVCSDESSVAESISYSRDICSMDKCKPFINDYQILASYMYMYMYTNM